MPVETTTEFLNYIKLLLRLEENDKIFDKELKTLILSAKEILLTAGIPIIVINSDKDEQIKDIIGIYCKHNFGREINELPDLFYWHIRQLKFKNWAKWIKENLMTK